MFPGFLDKKHKSNPYRSVVAMTLYNEAQSLYAAVNSSSIDGISNGQDYDLERRANELMKEATKAEEYFLRTGQEMQFEDEEETYKAQKN